MRKYVRKLNLLSIHDKKCPSCTNHGDYRAWRNMGPKAGTAGFCEDCTPKFKFEMMYIGKCDHPEIKFTRDRDGLLTGRIKQDTDSLSLDLFSI